MVRWERTVEGRPSGSAAGRIYESLMSLLTGYHVDHDELQSQSRDLLNSLGENAEDMPPRLHQTIPPQSQPDPTNFRGQKA
jgi:hypothetical protein